MKDARMKKLFVVALVAVGIISLFGSASAKDNFLMLRYETGKNTDTNEEVHGTYNVFENNTLKKWPLGFRVITGKNNFQMISLHAFYKLGKGWQLGAKYDSDSLDRELIGPAFRYVGVIGKKVFTILDVTQYFDIKDDNNKLDTWLHVSMTKKQGLYCGAEIWYYDIKHVSEHFKLRPIKIGYRYKDIGPFIMPQFHWQDWKYVGWSLLIGLDIIW